MDENGKAVTKRGRPAKTPEERERDKIISVAEKATKNAISEYVIHADAKKLRYIR